MAHRDDQPTATFTHYTQRDDRWQRVMLGVSSTTIGANGCLLCAIASGMADVEASIHGLPTDPPRLNRWLARNNGYVAPLSRTKERNLFVFNSLRPLGIDLVEYIDARKKPAPLDELEDALNSEDTFVAIHVDFNPGGSAQQHWVRALSWHDEDIAVMDPWITGPDQQVYLMTRYALPSWDDPARAIFRIAIYRSVGLKATYPTPSVVSRSLVQDELYDYPG